MISPSPHAPFELAFTSAVQHGVLVGVHLPPVADPVPAHIMDRLHADERLQAGPLRGFRQVQYVGGRLAAAHALLELGSRRQPVLSNEHGAPRLGNALAISISHKQDLAVALVARGDVGLGVDIEDTDRERPGVAQRVLTPAEFAENAALPDSRRWVDAVVRFSVKESVYKAIHAKVLRYVGFGEVAVWPAPDGTDRIEPLVPDLCIFQFEARHLWIGSRLLSTVRARGA